jgi:hypothetical protein
MSRKSKRTLAWIIPIVIILAILTFNAWSNIINLMMPADSRPARITYPVQEINTEEFEAIATQLEGLYDLSFEHIQRFREEGILAYEGPETCLACHEKITITDLATGEEHEEDVMENLTHSAHYQFFTKRHPNVWGFNGELADNFAMGKINRPCPKPGSFAMTAWAEIVVTEHGDTLSEGCGQCHIGGQHQAPLGGMMPGYSTQQVEKDAMDCLICHAAAYDMNEKQVVMDANGRKRWAQDRSMAAAMSITRPTSQACLRCHQHNFGGDIYVDQADPSYMQSMENTGHDRPRVMHPGSKRGTPFSPTWDVHAAAGLSCIDCHKTEGHRIAKGTHTTTMMANDLPDVEISCKECHGEAPHAENPELADFYNAHIEKIACQTCHIPSLHPDNATRRDFGNPVLEEHEGIYIYDDIQKDSAAGTGIQYVWWNGDATFLGNPIGDNPNGQNLYRFYDPTHTWPEFESFDYDTWYEEVMRPIAQKKPSKLYAMKLFNGRQHIDLQNIGPFGGMYVPYNLPTYYVSGNADLAAQKELDKSMMKMMYGAMFKYYMMNKFMSFMDVDGWSTSAYEDVHSLEKAEPRWIPNDAMLEISHAIRREGALTCTDCHSKNGVLDWKKLGYPEEDIEWLSENPLY